MSDPAPGERGSAGHSAWAVPLAAWALVCAAGHALWLDRPFVNQEQAFWCGARALLDPGFAEGFARYWREQANPLGYSAIAALATKALGLPLAPWSLRLPSLAGGVLLLLGGWLLARELRPRDPRLFAAWAGVVTLSPLVFVYAGEATADALPAGLALLALALAVRGRRSPRWHPVAAATLALAVLVKLNVALLAPGFAFAVASPGAGRNSPRVRLAHLAWYAALPGAALGLYAAWVGARFGHTVLPQRAWEIHAPSALGASWIAALAAYASYLALLLGPLGLLALWRLRAWPRRAAAVVAALACGAAVLAFAIPPGGEMGYGSFDRVLPGVLGGVARALGAAWAVVLAADLARRAAGESAWLARLTVVTVAPYLALSALSRPAQRYLLLVLPLVLLDAVLAGERRRRSLRAASIASMALFGALSLAASAAIAANGRAAAAMTDWIDAQGLLATTDPGALRGHTGHRFPLEPPPDARYLVVLGDAQPSLHQEPVVVLGRVLRRYALVDREADRSPQ